MCTSYCGVRVWRQSPTVVSMNKVFYIDWFTRARLFFNVCFLASCTSSGCLSDNGHRRLFCWIGSRGAAALHDGAGHCITGAPRSISPGQKQEHHQTWELLLTSSSGSENKFQSFQLHAFQLTCRFCSPLINYALPSPAGAYSVLPSPLLLRCKHCCCFEIEY